MILKLMNNYFILLYNMKTDIHPLWIVCIITRLLMIKFINYNNFKNKNIILTILTIMGLGFLNRYIFGSNNEIQIRKVFWHDSRLAHAVFYLLASYYYYINNMENNNKVLLTDIIFSFLYRFM